MLAWSGRADPGRQHLQLRRVQAAAQLRRLLQAGGRRAAQRSRARRATRPSARKLYEQIARDRAQGPADRLPVPPPLAVGVHDQARAACARFPTACVRVQGLKMAPTAMALARGRRDRRSSSGASRTIVPTLLFVSMLIFGLQQLLPGDPAMVLAGEERDPNVDRATCARRCTSTSRCRCATATGSAACCRATSASRCACRSRCAR